MIGMRPCPSGAFYGQEANTSDTGSESQDVDPCFTEEMLCSIQEQLESDSKTVEDEPGNVFKVNLEIFDEPMAAFFVTGWVNACVQNGSNQSEVHCGSLNQGEDESGKEVDSTVVPVEARTARQVPSCGQEVGLQGLLELGMLFRRASDLFAGGFNCFMWRAVRPSWTYVRDCGLVLWSWS